MIIPLPPSPQRRNTDNWILAPAKRIWVATLFMFLCVIIGILIYGNSKVQRAQHSLKAVVAEIHQDEATTCKVQAGGLKSAHALAQVMEDIHTVITFGTTRQPDQVKKLPHYVQRAYKDLNDNADVYFRLQRQEPLTRSCKH